ncbi:MAG TPA: chromate transporter [Candidatus Binataceae bacterium]|nr:chromate transporter [Candidatus Binataceae bacterium]
MHATKILNLLWVFALLSLVAVGGGTAVLPEMRRILVGHFHWLSDKQFREIYSIGQIAPGPNMLMVLVIGYRLAGALGAVVVGLAFFIPDCFITFFVNRVWKHFEGSPWRTAIQRGMAPVAIGLMLSGTYTVAKISIVDFVTGLIAVAVFAILYFRHVNPALLIIIGGVITLFVRGW